MKNAHLKKRVMTALVSATMVAGSMAVVAPDASAAAKTTADSWLTAGAYEQLSQADEARYYQQTRTGYQDANIKLLPTDKGSGWCIDWGLDNPWANSGGYSLRKLTGSSGRYGDGFKINDDVRAAAINVVTQLTKDYEAYDKGDASKKQAIDVETTVLRALLGNDLAALNEVRGNIFYGTPDQFGYQVSQSQFRNLTGFEIAYGTVKAGSGVPNYYLVPKDRAKLDAWKKQYENNYVTILVPNNYNYQMTRQRGVTFQRIIPIEQPGINPPKDGWDGKITETIYTTPPAKEVTTTVTQPPRVVTTTVNQPPQTTVTTVTHPATTVTETKTLPATTSTVTSTRPATTVTETSTLPTTTRTNVIKYPPTTVTETTTLPGQQVVTTVTTPGREVTKTVTPEPVTSTYTTTVNNTPKTETTVTQPPAVVTTLTEPGEPQTVTETRTAETKTITREPSTEVQTLTTTPVKTTEVTVPATTRRVTTTVTPKPEVSTSTVYNNYTEYREKVIEKTKEVHEYYYFAGFVEGEKSKEIEVPKNVGDSWTFEITKGRDIVDVERTDDGKLVITPKPDFKGEGDVEILITDGQGNQYVYTVKVSDTINVVDKTNVTVNNYFYTINPGSSNRVQEIDKNVKDRYNWYLVDENGNRVQPKPGTIKVVDDENKITVEVLDKDVRGNVVVRVTNENGDVRENVITIENNDTKFDVTREIYNTSTAIIERRGGTYKIVSGEDKVDIKQSEDGQNWLIKPKKDATGDVQIVFTDAHGVDYNYTLKIIEDQFGPVTRTDEITNVNSNDKADKPFAEIDPKVKDWTFEVVDGGDKADVEKVGGKLRVTPKGDNYGDVIVHVKDKDGNLLVVWTVRINPARDLDKLSLETRERDVVDRSEVRITRGVEDDKEQGIPGNTLEIIEGKDLIDTDRSKMGATGQWTLYFKPGAKGTVKVREQQVVVKDGKNTYVPVTDFIYTVAPAPVRELEYNVTSDNQITLAGTNLTVTEGQDLLAKTPEAGGKFVLDFKRTADGKLVVENRTKEGFLFERYTINVTPGREASFPTLSREMNWNGTARVPFNNDDKFRVIEGEGIVNPVREGDHLVIKGVPEKTGKSVVEVYDDRGTWAKYEINVVTPKVQLSEYTVSTNSQFIATAANGDRSFKVIEGSQHFEAPKLEGNQWILQPKADAAGKRGVVAEYGPKGEEISRYTVWITQGKVQQKRTDRDFVMVGSAKEFKPLDKANTLTVVSGSNFVDQKKGDNGALTLTAKANGIGDFVTVEERNQNGDVVRTLILSVVPAGSVTAEGNTIGSNDDYGKADKDKLPVVINNGTYTGEITIKFPEGVKGMAVTENGDKVKSAGTSEGATISLSDEAKAEIQKCIAEKKAKGEQIKPGDCNIPVKYIFVGENGMQGWDEQQLTITVNIDTSSETTKTVPTTGATAGKADVELDGKCIAGIVGLTAPLLLAIPVGILSQVQIPGLEGLSAQINAAIQDANTQIQKGLGIYDENRSATAAEIQAAFNIQNPQAIGLAASALGAITLGLLAVDGVMRACGAEEYTSSYQFGKATGKENIQYASSTKPGKSEARPTDKPAPDNKQ